MDNGWEESAGAWIREMGEEGDFGRQWVLDPAMLERAGDGPGDALDVGCGEGRFCRALAHRGWRTTGIDPTDRLIVTARERDTAGAYARAEGEKLPFGGARFDLVVSYLTLIDIADFRAAIGEMARVLKPGGRGECARECDALLAAPIVECPVRDASDAAVGPVVCRGCRGL